MEGFESMKTLAATVQRFGGDDKPFRDVKKAIADCQFYFRGHFRYQLRWSDECQDHCLSWALSDPTDEAFATQCDHEHPKDCFHCQNLRLIIGGLMSLLESFKSQLGDIVYDDEKFILEKSYTKILDYKKHCIRAAAQGGSWESLLDSMDETMVLVIVDWAMKLVPERYRETTKQW